MPRTCYGAPYRMRRPTDIQTQRLTLSVLLPEEIEALIAGEVRCVELASGFKYLPDDPNGGVDLGWHLRALQADNNQLPWRIRVIVERSSNTVVGSINLKGPPDNDGDVEIGWGLIEWAFQQPGVRSVSATVPDGNNASECVARRLGLTRIAATRRDMPLWKRGRNGRATQD
jgi:[ribosomal protein S5]-alanine N-acetyltransferase